MLTLFSLLLGAQAFAGRDHAKLEVPEPTLSVLVEHRLVGTVWHVPTGREVRPAKLLKALRTAEHVLLGEKHDNPDHHLLQAALVRALQPPAVVFEMLNGRSALDVSSAEDVASASAWESSGWPAFALYAPVFRATLEADASVVAAHPDGVTLKSVMSGEPGPDDLSFGGIELPNAARATLTELITDAHCGHASQTVVDFMIRGQRLKDRYLAEGLVNGGSGSVLVAGGGHTRGDLGVPTLLVETLSVQFVEVVEGELDPAAYEVHGDYAWFTARVDNIDPCEAFAEQLKAMSAHEGTP